MERIKQKPYFDWLPPLFNDIHIQLPNDSSIILSDLPGNQSQISIITDFYKHSCNLINFDHEHFEIIS